MLSLREYRECMPATEYDLLLKIQHLFFLADINSETRLALTRDDVDNLALRGQGFAQISGLQPFGLGTGIQQSKADRRCDGDKQDGPPFAEWCRFSTRVRRVSCNR